MRSGTRPRVGFCGLMSTWIVKSNRRRWMGDWVGAVLVLDRICLDRLGVRSETRATRLTRRTRGNFIIYLGQVVDLAKNVRVIPSLMVCRQEKSMRRSCDTFRLMAVLSSILLSPGLLIRLSPHIIIGQMHLAGPETPLALRLGNKWSERGDRGAVDSHINLDHRPGVDGHSVVEWIFRLAVDPDRVQANEGGYEGEDADSKDEDDCEAIPQAATNRSKGSDR
jgi:hypothetical protein